MLFLSLCFRFLGLVSGFVRLVLFAGSFILVLVVIILAFLVNFSFRLGAWRFLSFIFWFSRLLTFDGALIVRNSHSLISSSPLPCLNIEHCVDCASFAFSGFFTGFFFAFYPWLSSISCSTFLLGVTDRIRLYGRCVRTWARQKWDLRWLALVLLGSWMCLLIIWIIFAFSYFLQILFFEWRHLRLCGMLLCMACTGRALVFNGFPSCLGSLCKSTWKWGRWRSAWFKSTLRLPRCLNLFISHARLFLLLVHDSICYQTSSLCSLNWWLNWLTW